TQTLIGNAILLYHTTPAPTLPSSYCGTSLWKRRKNHLFFGIEIKACQNPTMVRLINDKLGKERPILKVQCQVKNPRSTTDFVSTNDLKELISTVEILNLTQIVRLAESCLASVNGTVFDPDSNSLLRAFVFISLQARE